MHVTPIKPLIVTFTINLLSIPILCFIMLYYGNMSKIILLLSSYLLPLVIFNAIMYKRYFETDSKNQTLLNLFSVVTIIVLSVFAFSAFISTLIWAMI